MVGNPKYNRGQFVKFEVDGEIMEGTIAIIDTYGTWEIHQMYLMIFLE